MTLKVLNLKEIEPHSHTLNFRITIPDGYPSIPPIIQNESEITEDKSDGMEMAEYDEDEDFLKVQEQFFDERLDSLGPDLGKFFRWTVYP